MRYDKFYNARDIITEIISKDLLGPVEEDEIICGESPLDYYIVGKLYPKDADVSNLCMSADDCGELDSEDTISLSNGKFPSSFSISFCLKNNADKFLLSASAAKYHILTEDEKKVIYGENPEDKSFSKIHWKRIPIEKNDICIDINEYEPGRIYKIIELDKDLYIRLLIHRVLKTGERIITISMTNEKFQNDDYKKSSLYAYFQPNITVKELTGNSFGALEHRTSLSTDPELIELDMLYRNEKNYVSGHGCAANSKFENGLMILYSDFLPKIELPQMKPSTRFSGKILSMKALSEMSASDIIDGLLELTKEYEKWIEQQQIIISEEGFKYTDIAEKNISKCFQTLDRMNKSIQSLNDKLVFKAFQLANKAMFNQRKDSLIRSGRYISDDKITWYPFQLAFFIQEIISFADENSTERDLTDLLWFPTGGGKTEAYLGISAFVIFLRRLRNKENGAGVSVIMRYTMRLLTFQQFERASAMICNCELIRNQENIPGGEISIGLWVGTALTPNKLADAEKILNGEEVQNGNYKIGSPVQISRCPYCGESISESDYRCDLTNKRMLISCPSPKCAFHHGLPIYLIDEEIYEHRPTYIVATIDKFAQMAVNENCANLFGDNNILPPNLIIQDELHLISGPLGTITGLYEAAIQKICTHNGIRPKVIASTATIRNASEQIKGLYGSNYTQFPPQAINHNDSFFAEISTRDEKAARMYLGCMAVGTSPTTMMIRTMASELFATRYLSEIIDDESVIDSYWTLTGYFNTLRELGGAIIRVIDDIQDRFIYLQNTKFKKAYPMKLLNQRYTKYRELTSREKSEDIGRIIQQELTIPFRKDNSNNPYDFLLSSNMISVGVDVSRLGIMQVVGQPKTTAEYIQATSRVGRENPGLVIATYNQAKSRDRSHYEQFYPYHTSFYRFVEATSITPFSDRARDRALQTLYVILCRYSIPDLFHDEDAVNYYKDMPELKQVREYIFSYVEKVDPDELENVKYEISLIEDEWEEKRGRNDTFRYRMNKYKINEKCLFAPDYEEDSRFRLLNSMRSVENSIQVEAGV